MPLWKNPWVNKERINLFQNAVGFNIFKDASCVYNYDHTNENVSYVD